MWFGRTFLAFSVLAFVLLSSFFGITLKTSSGNTSSGVSVALADNGSPLANNGILTSTGDIVGITVSWTQACKGSTVTIFVENPNATTWKVTVIQASNPAILNFPTDFPAGASASLPGGYLVWAQVSANNCKGSSNTVGFVSPGFPITVTTTSTTTSTYTTISTTTSTSVSTTTETDTSTSTTTETATMTETATATVTSGPSVISACGTTIYSDAILNSNLKCNSGTAITVAGQATLNCQGNTIDGGGSIFVGVDVTAVGAGAVVENCNVQNFAQDFFIEGNNVYFTQDTGSCTSGHSCVGFEITGSAYGISLSGNTAYGDTTGFSIDGVSDYLYSNTAYGNSQNGFYVEVGSEQNSLTQNVAYNNTGNGFRIDGTLNLIAQNLAGGSGQGNGNDGFYITVGLNYFNSNLANSNSKYGYQDTTTTTSTGFDFGTNNHYFGNTCDSLNNGGGTQSSPSGIC